MNETKEQDLKKLADFIEQDRRKRVPVFWGSLIVGIVLFILGLVLVLLGFGNVSKEMVITGGIFVLLGFIGIGIAITYRSNYSKKSFEMIRQYAIKNAFPNAKFNPNVGFPLKTVMGTGFFMTPDRYYGSNFLSDTYKGIPFEKASYRLQKREVRRTGKTTTVYYIDFAVGNLIFYHLPRTFKYDLRVLEKNGMMIKPNNCIETEFIKFNEKFYTTTNSKEFAFYILTPQVQEKILNLEGMAKGTFFLALENNLLYVAFNDGGNTADMKLLKKVNPSTVLRLYNFLTLPQQVIDILDLDGPKFQKQPEIV